MGKRQKEWARKARQKLIAELGGSCAQCGTKDNLVFDCIFPTGHDHHSKDTSARMSYYRREHACGNLQLLCAKHNNLKGDAIPGVSLFNQAAYDLYFARHLTPY